jgi:putative ABC transport system substrate-binding protein
VFVGGADPVAEGYVASLSRPGGNVTGFSNKEPSIATKRLQLLKEFAPHISRVAFIYDPLWPGSGEFLTELSGSVASFGIELSAMAVQTTADIERAIEAHAQEPNGGLIVYSAGSINAHRELPVASGRRLPTIYGSRYFVAEGGLMSYGVDANDTFRRAASYVDRISSLWLA